MQRQLFVFLLAAATVPSPALAEEQLGASYQSARSPDELQECLTRKLSERGTVTATNIEGVITLLYQQEKDRPMVIEVAPSTVKVTTRFAFGTRKLVEACLQ